MAIVLIAIDLAWVIAAAQARRFLKEPARCAHCQPCHRWRDRCPQLIADIGAL